MLIGPEPALTVPLIATPTGFAAVPVPFTSTAPVEATVPFTTTLPPAVSQICPPTFAVPVALISLPGLPASAKTLPPTAESIACAAEILPLLVASPLPVFTWIRKPVPVG